MAEKMKWVREVLKTTPKGRYVSVKLTEPAEGKYKKEGKDTYTVTLKLDANPITEKFANDIYKLQCELYSEVFGKKMPEDARRIIKRSEDEEGNEFFLITSTRIVKEGIANPVVCSNELGEEAPLSIIYPGCWGRIQFKFQNYDTEAGKGLKSVLMSVQHIQDDNKLTRPEAKGQLLGADYDSVSGDL